MSSGRHEPGEKSSPRQTVTITCNDNSHASKVAKIAFFHKRASEEWGIYPPMEFRNGNNQWALQEMDGNRPLSEEEMDPFFSGKDVVNVDRRFCYNLECALCDYKLSVTAENLNPKLDILAQHALKTIELRSLGAIMANSNKRVNTDPGRKTGEVGA